MRWQLQQEAGFSCTSAPGDSALGLVMERLCQMSEVEEVQRAEQLDAVSGAPHGRLHVAYVNSSMDQLDAALATSPHHHSTLDPHSRQPTCAAAA